MIVWSGRGIFSLLILFVALLISVSIFPETYVDLSFIVPLYITGIFSFILGIKWNRTLRVFIDKETGNKINNKSNHSLFWVKMEYWGIIFTAFGLIILAQNLNRTGTDLYINIFLVLIGIGALAFFIITLMKIKNSTAAGSAFENNSANAEPKLNFVKEEISTSKFKNEDNSQYLPK
ncbi:hypothetical protein EYY60_12130 [Flavobacterium zhairuonense]|uniref:hypothetical protein n=1 Tax=Flavobacterium zhairuonense TaxID=2493631 RepID=UPI001048453F|nr:hypothetical protein [Flavobacterium zhairuonense]KAF2510248.1 hypothetical protein EYY60_12130 [Flavobacterium zhairuonense]